MHWGLIILLIAALAALIALSAWVLAWVLLHPPRRTAGHYVARGLPTDPGDAGAAYETHRLELPHGVTIELWMVEGLREAADAPTIVLLHGWGDSRMGGLLWLDVLRPAARRIILFDQRGHGESPHRRCTLGAAERTDALAIAGFLRQRWPDSPVVLMGLSMGGVIAIDAAVEADSARIGGVIADSPYQRIGDAVGRFVRHHRLPARPIVDIAMLLLRMCGNRAAMLETRHRAASLSQPLLVIAGSNDPWSPADDAARIAEAAPRGELHWFDNAEHVQSACVDSERYAQVITQFTDSLTPRRAAAHERGA